MIEYNISYAKWSSIVDANSFAVCHVVDGSNTRKAFSGNRDYLFVCDVDVDDFDAPSTGYNAKYESNASICTRNDDARAQVVGIPLLPRGIDGTPYTTNIDVPDAAAVLFQSWQLDIPPNVTMVLDVGIFGHLVGAKKLSHLAGGQYTCRTAATQTSALHMAIVDRDDQYGAFVPYGLNKTKLAGLTNIVGLINVGDYVKGTTSGAKSKVLTVGPDYVEITYHTGWDANGSNIAWADPESVTFEDAAGTPTGASADTANWVEGDVLELIRYVRDEWLEGLDDGVFDPGGSKAFSEGFYYRFITYNADTVLNLRIKVQLKLGVE